MPYLKFNKGVGHRKGSGVKIGKYPVKVAKHVKQVLKNLNFELSQFDSNRIAGFITRTKNGQKE